VLEGVEGEDVLLEIKGVEGVVALPFSWISDAKLVMTDELIEESLRRRGGPPAGDDAGVELDAEASDADPLGDDPPPDESADGSSGGDAGETAAGAAPRPARGKKSNKRS
jgi:ribosome maturation factor RimP